MQRFLEKNFEQFKTTESFFTSRPEEFYARGIKNLPARWDYVIDNEARRLSWLDISIKTKKASVSFPSSRISFRSNSFDHWHFFVFRPSTCFLLIMTVFKTCDYSQLASLACCCLKLVFILWREFFRRIFKTPAEDVESKLPRSGYTPCSRKGSGEGASAIVPSYCQ